MTRDSRRRLEGRDLFFSRGERPILSGASLTLREGEIITLLGANGAGKSTLFRLLLGFLKPERGAVELDGKKLASYSRREAARSIAYVPQSHAAPFPYRVRDVTALGRIAQSGLLRPPGREDGQAVAAALEKLGITHLADRRYTEISGGERQLTLIARALAQGARMLIMDEPMTGLDYGYQHKMLAQLSALARDGCGVLVSTHNPEHALLVADRVAILENGRITADGPAPEVVTSAMIERIYGVCVETVNDERGVRRLLPASHASA
jgi:iron complex transport system ATP-binding protein